LLRQFVCVRILAMNDVDLALFQFDYDLTWMGFFLSADNRIYSRYGGRDAKSDDGRLSVQGLKVAMGRVLERHRQPPGGKPAPHRPRLPHEVFRVDRKACLHCHQVWEGLRARQRKEGTFEAASLYVYPPPENVGLELDVPAGNRVVKVRPGSPAARAGLRAGDEVRRIGEVDVLAQGDVFWALHNAPSPGRLAVGYARGGRTATTVLELPAGWRKTDLSWRQSMANEKGPE
jgi:hypothetical protein